MQQLFSPTQTPKNSAKPPFADAQNKIKQAKDILVILPQMPTLDSIASALALFSTIQQSYQDKFIQISSAATLTDQFKKVNFADQINSTVGSENLVISLDTEYENVEKISQDNTDNKFNLIVEMKNKQKLSQDKINFSYRGVSSDLLICVGCLNQQQVGSLLTQEPNLFVGRECITIANQFGAQTFGTINIHDTQSSSIAEIISRFIRHLKIKLTDQAATNLLAGIESSTNNFSFKTTANTFAAASFLMRLGAKRNFISSSSPFKSPFSQSQSFPSSFTPPSNPFSPTTPPSNPFSTSTPPAFPSPSSQNTPPPPIFNNQESTNQSNVNSSQSNSSSTTPSPSNDWLQPKIFQGGISKN